MEAGGGGSTSTKKATACVTGGTGYIGSMLVKTLLERGYAVRATVRNPDDEKSIAHLTALRSLGELSILRADLSESGSFDDVVAGCDYVFHVATVGGLNCEDSDTERNLIQPEVEGTLNILRSCVKAKSVRRVVYTSSAAAVSVNRMKGVDLIFHEDSWSDVELLTAEKPPTWDYLASKTIAEKEAWRFAEEHKLDFVAINPVLVVGRGLSPRPPLSLQLSLCLLTGDESALSSLKTMQKVSGSVSLVHLEDVCRAFIFLVETSSTSGRYILSQINTSLQELATFLQERYPQYNKTLNISDAPEKSILGLSSEKICNDGFKFVHETLEDIYEELVEYGMAIGVLPLNPTSLI